MPAELSNIADAVAAAINAAEGLTGMAGVTAVRSHQPVHDLAALDTLAVSVVPRGRSFAVLDRSQAARDFVIDVVVQKRVTAEPGPDKEAEIDALSLLVEEF